MKVECLELPGMVWVGSQIEAHAILKTGSIETNAIEVNEGNWMDTGETWDRYMTEM